MDRLLIRFLTRYPFRPDVRPVAALILYDVRLRDLIGRILALRRRLDGRGGDGPRGYLINDGSVLAAELLRDLPSLPLGHASIAPADPQADHVLDVVTDAGRPTLCWEFLLDGVPVDDGLAPAWTLSRL